MKKSSSGWKKGAAISTTKSPPQIKKDDICAYFSGRNEFEVIVDPDRLEQIMVAPRQQIRETMKMK